PPSGRTGCGSRFRTGIPRPASIAARRLTRAPPQTVSGRAIAGRRGECCWNTRCARSLMVDSSLRLSQPGPLRSSARHSKLEIDELLGARLRNDQKVHDHERGQADLHDVRFQHPAQARELAREHELIYPYREHESAHEQREFRIQWAVPAGPKDSVDDLPG